MASPITTPSNLDSAPPSLVLDGLPLLYEDDEEGDMGETNLHEITAGIFRFGLEAHFAGQSQFQVFSNLNLYYQPTDPKAYVSPDLMVVKPFSRLSEDLSSYRINMHGPAPLLTVEILSERSGQQRDLREKVVVYAKLRVAEYCLVDVSGRFLPERLLMKRLQPDGTWKNEQDVDGGITSQFGFRVIIDGDGKLHVTNLTSGKPYVRPDEAEKRVRELEAEVAQLREKIKDLEKPSRPS